MPTNTPTKTRSFWGWGYEDFPLPAANLEKFKNLLQFSLGIKQFENYAAPTIESLNLRAPRFKLPTALNGICTDATFDRASHCYGKSFRDIWRAFHGHFDNPPDYIAYPRSEKDIQMLFDFAGKNHIALIPFGGGTSVCGGVEPTRSADYEGVITVDLKHFDKILEIDKQSRAARIQGGIFGPALEAGLKPHGLTMRHYPQSFEFSTLGGWIATRGGGHFATLYTHIDEFVQSVRMVSPNGIMETRRLPGSGAGPSEERLLCGSEGIFGIITEAWMRLQDIPKFKKTVTVQFKDFFAGVEACRLIAQSGLNPSNARLVSALEAMSNGLGDGSHSVLIVGFESHRHSVEEWMRLALEICESCGGIWNKTPKSNSDSTKRDKAADEWKRSFLAAPYLRDEFVRLGLIVETFETAITWDQFPIFHKAIEETAMAAITELCGAGTITCRFTHLYPDGPAPYYTIMARGKKGKELEQWDQIKERVSNKIIEQGGTITHHHAVGKDHRPFYENQRSQPFGEILSSVKNTLDPAWILNPDVLIAKKK